MTDFHKPRGPYTRDPSLRLHMSGPIEPMDYGINVRRELAGGVFVTVLVGLMLVGWWVAT